MKLAIKIELDTGGTIILNGEDLSAEDVNEVFGMLQGHTVVSVHPKGHPDVVAAMEQLDDLHTSFREGFDEGRPQPMGKGPGPGQPGDASDAT